MNRGTSVLIVIGAIALVALIAAVLGGTTTQISFAPAELQACPRDGAPAACVVGKSASDPGGLSIFGTTLFATEVIYRVAVQVQSTRDCVERVYGVDRVERWPAPFAECASDFTRPGQIAGTGALGPSGGQALMIEVEVSEDCYLAVVSGRAWPEDAPVCS